MLIANPIYDVVFKYLMEDSKVAKLLIGSIIGAEVLELEFRPKSFTTSVHLDPLSIKPTFTIYHLDFSAKIKTPAEEKLVIIEVQKAKLATDILRFRQYLGKQYSDKKNVYTIENQDGSNKTLALPIISIYFLGHSLESIQDIPVIHVNRKYIDLYSKTEIPQKDYFIECLSHDSYVISIQDLKTRRRNELEILLSVFDQSNQTEDQHILNVREDDFPEQFRSIIRRLQKAVEVPEIRDNMEAEDTYLEELENQERRALEAEKIAKEAFKQIAEEKQKTEEAERKIEQEKQRAEQEKQRAEQLYQEKLQTLHRMRQAGLPETDICAFLNISPEELEQMTNGSSDEWRISLCTSAPLSDQPDSSFIIRNIRHSFYCLINFCAPTTLPLALRSVR